MIPRVPFFSFCEHHIAPISGSITIGYAPGEHIIGLGRLTTALEHFSHRLILQEPFTTELAELLTEVLQPQGLAVVVDAVHSCIQMRGERRQGGPLRTAHFSGSFSNQLSLREEFWHLMAV